MATDEQKAHIASLESAYEKLISGARAAVVVDSTGERVEWTRGNEQALKSYIREKKLEYGLVSAARPLRVMF